MFKRIINTIRKGRKTRLIVIVAIIAIVAPLALNTLLNMRANSVKADSFFNFDEGYGTTSAVHDSNGAVSAGSITGATWKTEDLCISGKCVFFDGAGDYISLGNVFNFVAADNFTISFWMRHAPKTTGTDVMIAKTSASAGYKIQMESDGDITFAIDDDTTWTPDASVTSTAATYDDNQWHNITAVKTGTTKIELYIDGVLVGTNSSISGVGSLSNSNNFYVGIDGNGSSNPFTGFIDELKVYTTTAKTADTIKTDIIKGSALGGVSASFGPDPSWLSNGLVGYWKMDESSGNISDYSGNGYTMTNNSTATFVSGKFGNGSEYVPASSQYFSITSSSDYCFDASVTSGYQIGFMATDQMDLTVIPVHTQTRTADS